MKITRLQEFLKRRRKIRLEAQQLKEVPPIKCGAERLSSAEKVRPQEAFNSERTGREWDAIAPVIESFQLSKGRGGVNPGDGRAIFYLISHLRPRSVLEIGTNVGASTVHITAALHNSLGLEEKKRPEFVSVDIKDVNDVTIKPRLQRRTPYSPAEMVDRMGCADLVEFVTSPSLDYFVTCDRKYDFIFLDGDHAAKTVYQEIPAALRLLENNGSILLHDYFPALKPLWSNGSVIPGPFLATERLITEGAGFKTIPLGHLPWPTKLGSNVTSLALLARI